ncbi:V-type ATPase subunit [Clostridium polynesiense]|uniref:V-type ATPase subunit n=1 Tax=Clostridium polynesiense TaxID=1325933 RepID=UPI0005916A37|nr:V-type ATPase subunit [Clostridium polynesiense]
MGNIIRYGAVNTKIKAMQGKLLTEEQYKKLISANSYEECIRILKEETNYSELFQGIPADSMRRGHFEVILKRYHIKKLYKLSHYFNGEYKKLIKILFMRYEIEDIKVIIRSKYVNRSREDIEDMLTFKSPLTTIDYDYLLSSNSAEEVIQRLKGTIYYRHIKELEDRIRNEGLFRLENNLDFAYYSSLRKFIKKLNNEDKKIISDITGFEADLLNVTAIYRGRKYYDMSPEEMYNYTIYDYYKLNPEILKKMCYVKNFNEYYEILKDLPYKQIIPMNENSDFLIEAYERASLKKFLSKYLASSKQNISIVISYFYLLQIEIQNIVSIVENKRYDSHNNEMNKFITTAL